MKELRKIEEFAKFANGLNTLALGIFEPPSPSSSSSSTDTAVQHDESGVPVSDIEA